MPADCAPAEPSWCRIPRRIEFARPPRIRVEVRPTTRRHALARASVTLIADQMIELGDFILFEQDGKVVVAGPRALRLSYQLGKRIEMEVLASFKEWERKREWMRP